MGTWGSCTSWRRPCPCICDSCESHTDELTVVATQPDKSPDRISGMFDAIAPRYDLLNHLLSAGIDRRWRAAAIRSLRLTSTDTLLDLCCGTADVALAARRGGRTRGPAGRSGG